MAPEDMNMQMHMVGAMYAPTSKITLAAMMNYLQNEMNATMMGGMNHYHASRDWAILKSMQLRDYGNQKDNLFT